MTSTLILYKDSRIIPERNLIVEDISTYLSGLTKLTKTDFQYQRLHLEMDVKIDISQTYQDYKSTYNYNYCSIQDGLNGKIVYYFITKKTQVAESTIALHLKMDTANTFQRSTDYSFGDRTRVIREHKDRFDIWYYEIEIRDPQPITQTNPFPYSDETPFPISISIDNGSYNFTNLTAEYWDDGNHSQLRIYGMSMEEGKEIHDLILEYSDEPIDFYDGDMSTHYCRVPYPTDQYDIQEFYFNKKYVRKIDLKSEEISAPVYKKQENVIYENTGDITNTWALYYRNATGDVDEPIDCYLVPDMNLYVNYQNTTPIITPSDIPNGKYLTISSEFNGEISLVVNGTTYRIRKEISNGYTYYYLPFIYNNSGTLELYWTKWSNFPAPNPDILYRLAGGSMINPAKTTTTGFDVDTNLEEIGVLILDDMPDGIYPIAKADYIDASAINDTISFATTLQTTINSINSIDRTMKQNIKIIDIPYSPSNISDESGTITMDGTWGYDSQTGFFKLRNYNVRFQNFITTNIDDILKYFETNISTINTNATRYIKDSKLYHSDYFRPKFVYDSFTKVFPLEQMDYGESIMLKSNDKFEFTFVMSRNIVSKFLFQFNYIYKQSMEDYPNMLAVARNNEEVLYNSQYLNYIRTGYNYDLKTKERNEVASGIGLGLSVASLIGSIALSASGYGSAIGVAGIVGSLGGIAGSVVGMAKSVAQAEDNIQRKLQETQRESVSVLNADDSDLLYAYTGNKAKMCVYTISNQMEEILDDMFYYVGYLCNETKIPNLSSRYWFNFIQAEVELTTSGSNLSEEVINDLKQRYSNGITILHHQVIGGNTNAWDFDLNKENWEVSLL